MREELLRHGKEAIELLQQAEHKLEGAVRAEAALLLQELFDKSPKQMFLKFIHSARHELGTGMLLLERLVDSTVESVTYRPFIEKVADRCRDLMTYSDSPLHKCGVINRVIFEEYGFHGDVEHFYDPQNSLLSKVIVRRRGLSLGLSVVYLLVAELCNLRLSPIAMPGRFLLGCFMEEEPFYIDCFEQGVFLKTAEVEAMLRSYEIEPHPAYMQPCRVGELLLCCCRNLVRQYARYGNEKNANLFAGFVAELEMVCRNRK